MTPGKCDRLLGLKASTVSHSIHLAAILSIVQPTADPHFFAPVEKTGGPLPVVFVHG